MGIHGRLDPSKAGRVAPPLGTSVRPCCARTADGGAHPPTPLAMILSYKFYLVRRLYLFLVATYISTPLPGGNPLGIPHIAYIEEVPTRALSLYITGMRRYRRGTSFLRGAAYIYFLARGG